MLSHSHLEADPGETVIWCVPPALVTSVLPNVRDYLHEAYRKSGNNYAENIIVNEIKNNRMALWVAYRKGNREFDAAMTTRIYQNEDHKVCQIIALGGRGVKNWIKYMDQIERYALWEGCDTVRIEGREGWSRLLPSFVTVGRIIERRIANDG